jgi:hypothetical protein
VEEAEMSRIIESEKLEVLKPESQTRPCVYYKNLYRYNKCFIAGSVEVNKAGVSDCAEGAKVTLRRSQQKLEDTVTDNFGDFKFDKLAENSGQYIIDIELKGQKKATVSVELTTSQNVGTICL